MAAQLGDASVGYIDSDGHVRESEGTWDYLDPSARALRPHTDGDGIWVVEGTRVIRPFSASDMPDEYNALFPPGSVDLSEPGVRVARLDALGIDVQVLFTSFWLNLDVASVELEVALMRSWNRWMADRADDSGGRLVWAAEIPFRDTDAALADMEHAKEHGAVAIRLSGLRHGIGVANPIYWPLYEKAQDLDLVVAVHSGGDRRRTAKDRSLFLLNAVAPVAGAWYALSSTKPPEVPEDQMGVSGGRRHLVTLRRPRGDESG